MVINLSRKTVFIVAAASGVVIILGLAAFFIINSKNTKQSQVSNIRGISGVYHINGVIPAGSTITLSAREVHTNSAFTPFLQNINPKDESLWWFADGINGKSYEIQADVVQNGKVIYNSGSISVTAPALNQVLTFNLPSDKPDGKATVFGIIVINGYIPDNAAVTVEARKLGTKTFNVISSSSPAKSAQTLNYDTAVSGETYELKALLYDGNNNIGESSILNVVAPATNEELEVNSTAKPPAVSTPTPTPTLTARAQNIVPLQSKTITPKLSVAPTAIPTPQASISGVIRFNGQVPANSRIVILQRVSGTTDYQVALDNLLPQDGIAWKWSGGQTGITYDLLAVLKQKQTNGTDTDISYSNLLSLAVPAINADLTINSGFLLSASAGNISVTCGSYDSNTQIWTAGVSFQTISGAQAYWYQIGTTSGGNELTNFTQNGTNNSSQSFTEPFKNGVTYYARYAYANVPNLSANDVQFSPLSGVVSLKCSQ